MKNKINKEAVIVDEFINALPERERKIMSELRILIQKSAPKAEEGLSYGVPAFKLEGFIACYSAFKNHYSLFPTPSAIVAFKEKLKEYELSKGTIKFTYTKPIPKKLIADIIKFKVKENLKNKKKK
jgi:uncharacterized protein YdhG (YjbR/CyaY superfamily)